LVELLLSVAYTASLRLQSRFEAAKLIVKKRLFRSMKSSCA